MRTVAIPIRNTQKVEVFVEKHNDHFELWIVGMVKERRMVLSHHLTHGDLETHLEYARPEDLIWRDAERSEIPDEKHQNAIEMEETITRGVFWDGVASHFDSIAFITKDRKALLSAQKAILGRWTDGSLTFDLKPEHGLAWSCTDPKHWLGRFAGPNPDWWNFKQWQFAFMSDVGKNSMSGCRNEIIHVDERELHFRGGHKNRMAYVFRRENAA
jgi:hypothetical protein